MNIVRLIIVFLALAASAIAHSAVDLDLNITGAQPSAISPMVVVQHVELSFARGGVSPTVALNQEGWYAQARIRYQGNGVLTVRWLVDGYMVSRQAQVLGFGGNITLRSDQSGLALPTFQPGLHVVTLQLESVSATAPKVPSIHYFVAPRSTETAMAPLLTLTPKDSDSVNTAQLEFQWNADADYSGFRLELERLAMTPGSANVTVLAAETRHTRYVPTGAQRAGLTAGDYRWRVRGYSRKTTEPTATPWQALRLATQTNPERIALRSITRTKAVAPNLTGTLSSPLSDTQPLRIPMRVTSDETVLLRIRIENDRMLPTRSLSVELADTRGVVVRQGLPPIAAKQFLETTLPWHVPVQLAQSTVRVRLVEEKSLLDEASINWKAEKGIALQNLDFHEHTPQALPTLAITDPASCPKAVGPLGGDDRSGSVPDAKLAYAQVLGVIAASGEGFKVASSPVLIADERQALRATAYIEDRGLVDAYVAKWRACRENVIDALRVSGLGSQEFTALQEESQRCREGPREETCTKIIARYDDAVRVLGGTVDLSPEPPDSVPLEFLAYPIDAANNKSAPIALGVVRLHRGEKNTVRSPLWRTPRSGRYVLSVHGLGRSANLIARPANGLPNQLDLAGFMLQVQSYDAGSSLNHLSGLAKTTWKDDSRNTQLPMRFEGSVTTGSNHDPLRMRLASGRASLVPGSSPSIEPNGKRLDLQKLDLTENEAKAAFRYRFPASIADDHPGVVFSDVAVLNGGELIVEKTLASDTQPLILSNRDLIVTLAGATLALDLAPHLANIRAGGTQEPISVTLREASVRVRAFASAASADGFLFGQAPSLRITESGVSGIDISAESGSATSFNDTSLSISGGDFELINNKLGGVRLSGKFSPTGQSQPANVEFQGLRRVTATHSKNALRGYATEILDVRGDGTDRKRVLWPALDAAPGSNPLAGEYGLSPVETFAEAATAPASSITDTRAQSAIGQIRRDTTAELRPNTVAGSATRNNDKVARVRFWMENDSTQVIAGETTSNGTYSATLANGVWIGSACESNKGYEPSYWRVSITDGNVIATEKLASRPQTIQEITAGIWQPGQIATLTGHGFSCAGKIILTVIPDPARLLRTPSPEALHIEVTEFVEHDDSHVSFIVPPLPTLTYGAISALGADVEPDTAVTTGNASVVFENAGVTSDTLLFAYETGAAAR